MATVTKESCTSCAIGSATDGLGRVTRTSTLLFKSDLPAFQTILAPLQVRPEHVVSVDYFRANAETVGGRAGTPSSVVQGLAGSRARLYEGHPSGEGVP